MIKRFGTLVGAVAVTAVVAIAILARPTGEQQPEVPISTQRIAVGAATSTEPLQRGTATPQPPSASDQRTGPTCFVEAEAALAYIDPVELDKLIEAAGGQGRMLRPGLFAGSLEEATDAFGGQLDGDSSRDGDAWLRMQDELGPYLRQLVGLRSEQGAPVWQAANIKREVPCPSSEY